MCADTVEHCGITGSGFSIFKFAPEANGNPVKEKRYGYSFVKVWEYCT